MQNLSSLQKKKLSLTLVFLVSHTFFPYNSSSRDYDLIAAANVLWGKCFLLLKFLVYRNITCSHFPQLLLCVIPVLTQLQNVLGKSLYKCTYINYMYPRIYICMYINMYELCVRTCVKILKRIKIFVQQDTRYRDAESQLAKSRNSYQIYLCLF